jgi:hypothetical protein
MIPAMPWLAMLTMIAAIRAAQWDGCVIEVVELPVPARAHHRLDVDGGRARLDGDALRLQISLQAVIVRLVGPRYFGELRLTQAACSGNTTHFLRAHPRPAVLVFEAAPKDLVVKVIAGPDSLDAMRGEWVVARSFPPLPIGHGALVELELMAPHFVPARRKLRLLPGDNEIEVALEVPR